MGHLVFTCVQRQILRCFSGKIVNCAFSCTNLVIWLKVWFRHFCSNLTCPSVCLPIHPSVEDTVVFDHEFLDHRQQASSVLLQVWIYTVQIWTIQAPVQCWLRPPFTNLCVLCKSSCLHEQPKVVISDLSVLVFHDYTTKLQIMNLWERWGLSASAFWNFWSMLGVALGLWWGQSGQ